VHDGDEIAIDAVHNKIEWLVSEAEVAKRRAIWSPPPLKAKRGVLYKYAQQVSSASKGCITDQ